MDLVTKVVMKLARGHVAHWLATPEYDEPQLKIVTPLEGLPEAARREFETLPEESVWPEIGSRAFLESVVVLTGSLDQSVYLPSGWNIVQPDRYRYAVSYSKRIEARIVLSEYLACLVAW